MQTLLLLADMLQRLQEQRLLRRMLSGMLVLFGIIAVLANFVAALMMAALGWMHAWLITNGTSNTNALLLTVVAAFTLIAVPALIIKRRLKPASTPSVLDAFIAGFMRK